MKALWHSGYVGRASAAIVVSIVALSIAPLVVRAGLETHTPLVLQVTTAPGQTVGGPRFSIGQNIIVFHSDGDLLQNGNTVPQVFLFDLAARVTGKKRPGLYQLTFGDQPSLAPTAASRGRVLAFHSTDDPYNTGSVGRQLFVSRKARWKKGNVPLLQLTRGTSESFDSVLTKNGRYVFFVSNGDLTSESLPPGTHLYRSEIAKFEKSKCPGYPCPIGNPALNLVSRETAAHPAPDNTGKRVVFESRGNAAGTGCVNGAVQLFLRDFTRNTTEQLTFGVADSRNPVFTSNDKAVFFDSAADLNLNGNAARNVFMVDLAADPSFFGGGRPIRQITFGTDGDSYEPAPSQKGNLVFLKSTASWANASPGVERLFAFDRDSGTYVRLTNGEPILSNLTNHGAFVSFASTADFAGQNPSGGAEIFLINARPLLDIPLLTTPTPAPTATPMPGEPATIALSMLTNGAGDEGNGTLTTVLAVAVHDVLGDPVPTGTFVDFSVQAPSGGALVNDGSTDTTPICDVSTFESQTGVTVTNTAGVAHACLNYPSTEAGSLRTIVATAGQASTVENLVLPCASDGAPCNDANPCTQGDVCSGGSCQSGVPVICSDDGNPCTEDICNPSTGTCGLPQACACP